MLLLLRDQLSFWCDVAHGLATAFRMGMHPSHSTSIQNQNEDQEYKKKDLGPWISQSFLEFILLSSGGSIVTSFMLGTPISFLLNQSNMFLWYILAWYFILWCPLGVSLQLQNLFQWKFISGIITLLDDLSWCDVIAYGGEKAEQSLAAFSRMGSIIDSRMDSENLGALGKNEFLLAQILCGTLIGCMGGILHKSFDMGNSMHWRFKFKPEYLGNPDVRLTFFTSLIFVVGRSFFHVDLYWPVMGYFLMRSVFYSFGFEFISEFIENVCFGYFIIFFNRKFFQNLNHYQNDMQDDFQNDMQDDFHLIQNNKNIVNDKRKGIEKRNINKSNSKQQIKQVKSLNSKFD